MATLTLKSVKKIALDHGKTVVFNRSLGGYQVKTNPFCFSEVVYPHRDSKGAIYMPQGSLQELLRMI
jgi:hypothetical protein